MKSELYKRLLSGVLSLTMVVSLLPINAWGTEIGHLTSPLLITEIVPNTTSDDKFEYYELTNTSSLSINLSDFNIKYDYSSGISNWSPEDVTVLPARTSMVVWVKNDYNTGENALDKDDFIAYYNDLNNNSNLNQDSIIAEISCNGFANKGARTLYVETKTGLTINSVGYEHTFSDNQAVVFSYDGNTVNTTYENTPTPCVTPNITDEFTMETVNDPAISCSNAERVAFGDDLVVTVTDTNLNTIVCATVTAEGETYNMTYDGQTLSTTIPASDLAELAEVTYVVTATDGLHSATSSIYTTKVEQPVGELKLSSPVLITEIVPNTDNISSSDGYEYYELTNTTNEAVDLSAFNVKYYYGSGTSTWNPSITTMPANSSIIVWVKNSKNTETGMSAFQEYYSLGDDDLVAEVYCNGFANSGERTLYLETKSGEIVNTVGYTDHSFGVDEGVIFSYTGNSVTTNYDHCTPGVPSSIDGTYAMPDSATVAVTEVTEMVASDNLTIEVTNCDLDLIAEATLTANGTDYNMTYDGENLSATIDGGTFDTDSVEYAVTVTDGITSATSESYTIAVTQLEEVDTTLAPILTISELMPDTSNINGADGYEYIEIYNNAHYAIDLKDYVLQYYYPTSSSTAPWWNPTESTVLESGECIVIWIKNSANQDSDLSIFNDFYSTNLTENQVIELDNAGMANGSGRGFYITSKIGDIIDFVEYNKDGADDTTTDKSINFVTTYADGAFTSILKENAGDPTPGTIGVYIPTYDSTVLAATSTPVAVDNTPDRYSNSTKQLDFSVTATSSDSVVKSVFANIKDSTSDDTFTYQLYRENGDVFTKSLSQVELLNKGSFTYSFTISNGTNSITTDEKTIYNTDGSGEKAFNLTEGQVVSGTQDFIAVGNQILVNGADVTNDSVCSLSGNGQIVFNASQTDVFFKNAVSVGDNLLGIFEEGTYSETATYNYGVDPVFYDADNKTIGIEFHAGNKANALEHNIENNDDFTLQNIRMVLPNGKTIYCTSYEAIKGLGAVEHEGLYDQPHVSVTVDNIEQLINMGDGTSKYEILFANFTLEDSDFSAMRYTADTTDLPDGDCTISNGTDNITITVDNTAPIITTNVVNDEEYHAITITASANDAVSGSATVTAVLDGKKIRLPHVISSVEVAAGTHQLELTATDNVGNTTTKIVNFTTPVEHASFTNVMPEDGSTVRGNPTLSTTVIDPSDDDMTVTFKMGEGYELGDDAIVTTSGISCTSGTNVLSVDGFNFEQFDLTVSEHVTADSHVAVEWTGVSNNEKTFLYVYNVITDNWDKIDATKAVDGDNMILSATVALTNHLGGETVKFMVQNGEGYTPEQYDESTFDSKNEDDTPRADYDFTFAIESDTQYYNEDYDGNPDQSIDGVYEHQLNINNWLMDNRQSMNIQYMFHNGDIVDDSHNIREWEQADAAYKILDDENFPYGMLAGNHDVGHTDGNYDSYTQYFGDNRFSANPWFWESYDNNKGHYDLISVDGMDFLMLYMGWDINDAEIDWMNKVLAQYPERIAILNLHEYLLASKGLGEIPQRIYNEVVAVNENICLIFCGHYHNAATRVDTFNNQDGTTRNVYSMLFDYQGLPEGGMGYIRLLHFNVEDKTMVIRTYSPSLNDYNAAESNSVNEGNKQTIPGADTLKGGEEFTLSFDDLGISATEKTLTTSNFTAQVYGNEIIGAPQQIESGTTASVVCTELQTGIYSWYAEATDEHGGIARTKVQTMDVTKNTMSGGNTGSSTSKPVVDKEDISEKPQQPIFADVTNSDWYTDAVHYVVEKGLFKGISDTTFAPNQNMTRAMIFTVLHRMSGDETFTNGALWYTDGMDWARFMGISDGTNPNGNVTREQLVTMLYRYINGDTAVADLSIYDDAKDVSPWAQDGMAWAVGNGIINGKTPTTLQPKAFASRAEVATILMRFLQQ